MKKKCFPPIPVFICIVLFIFTVQSCAPPEIPPPGPEAIIGFQNSEDPYIVKDKSFSLKVVMNLSGDNLGFYDFTFFYDPSQIEVNRNEGAQGVSPGEDGFLNVVNSPVPGILEVSGFSEEGIAPSEAIQLLELHWTALRSGETEITLKVNTLQTPLSRQIDTGVDRSYKVGIDEPSFYSLSGRILDSIGGAPVSGARVEVEGTDNAVISDNEGRFTLENILIGVYDILATGSGRAGSRLEQVHINENLEGVEMIQLLYAFDPGGVIPPSIAVRGIKPFGEYSGTVPVDIRITPGSNTVTATEFHKSIYLKIGMTDKNYVEEINATGDFLSHQFNTTFLPAGEANIKVVSYDNNNNRSEMNIPVFFADNPGKKPSVAPLDDYFMIVASTYGKSLNLAKNESPPTRAPENSSIIVELSVLKYYNGVVVYKSDLPGGDYKLIGQTSFLSDNTYEYVDYSPDLMPDTTVYYKLGYFNQHGIGPLTEPISVRILPRYSLQLVSPADNSFIAEKKPAINWSCGIIPDARRIDWITVMNVMDGTVVVYSFVINTNELTLPELLYNHKYEWDVKSYYEYNNSETESNVLSRSFPGGQGATDFSDNGAFRFTVLQE